MKYTSSVAGPGFHVLVVPLGSISWRAGKLSPIARGLVFGRGDSYDLGNALA